MKCRKILVSFVCMLVVLTVVLGFKIQVQADSKEKSNTISNGIYIDEIDVSGMSQEEATEVIESYLADLGDKTITFVIDSNEVVVSASDLGMEWKNKDVVEDAANLGKTGNIIQRYKALKDLERENKNYPIKISFDQNKIEAVINEKCLVFNVEPIDASIKRENGKFVVTDGQTGVGVDVLASVKLVEDSLKEWDKADTSIELAVELVQPKATKDDFDKVNDVLATFTTSYSSSGFARSANIDNGARLVNGTVLLPGETFSTYKAISPFSVENGYYLAGSYLQGQVVDLSLIHI